jgi:hypothetical protein
MYVTEGPDRHTSPAPLVFLPPGLEKSPGSPNGIGEMSNKKCPPAHILETGFSETQDQELYGFTMH